MENVEKTILSQYANSPTIVALIKGMNDCIDPRADLDNFYNLIWNVDTANGMGLDIWGRIVNISRQVNIPIEQYYFGFNEAGNSAFPFNNYPFYNGKTASQTYTLSNEAYRKLILAKAMANIAAMTIPSYNRLLTNYFSDRGTCYLKDVKSMTMQIVFDFSLTPVEYAILTQSGAFPTPTGVEMLEPIQP